MYFFLQAVGSFLIFDLPFLKVMLMSRSSKVSSIVKALFNALMTARKFSVRDLSQSDFGLLNNLKAQSLGIWPIRSVLKC